MYVYWVLSFLAAFGGQLQCEEHWTGLLEGERRAARLPPSPQPATSHVSEVVQDQPAPGWPQKLSEYTHSTWSREDTAQISPTQTINHRIISNKRLYEATKFWSGLLPSQNQLIPRFSDKRQHLTQRNKTADKISGIRELEGKMFLGDGE